MAEDSDDGPLEAVTAAVEIAVETSVEIALDLRAPAWSKALPDAEAICERAVEAAYAVAALPAGEISLVLADDAFIRYAQPRP